MDGNEFSFYKIIKSEKEVVQPFLKDIFETRWNAKHPDTPWTADEVSVQLFESEEEKVFEKNYAKLPNNVKWRKKEKRKRIIDTYHDEQWKNYEWDVSKFTYALVDSKVFSLEETDEEGIAASEHIVMLKNIRNNFAHLSTSKCHKEYCRKILKEICGHIKAINVPGIDKSKYLEKIDRIKLEESPVSSKEHYEMRTQYEKLKYENLIYIERDKTYEEKEKNIKLTVKLNEGKENTNKLTAELNEEKEKNNKLLEMLNVEKKRNKTLLDEQNKAKEKNRKLLEELNVVKRQRNGLLQKLRSAKLQKRVPVKSKKKENMDTSIDELRSEIKSMQMVLDELNFSPSLKTMSMSIWIMLNA